MQFYTKKEDGEFVEASQDQFEEFFKSRIERLRSTEREKVKTELEESVRKEVEPKLKEDLTKTLTEQLEAQYKPKLEQTESELSKTQIQLRQKTVAAEYGFKSDLESFLGDGTEEEMRQKADVLKQNAGNVTTTQPPEKKTEESTTTQGFVTKTS